MIKIILLLGAGIAIFLFGMLRLGAEIQKRFTARIRTYIRYAVREARDRHLARFHNRQCPAESSPVFIEMLIHLERISDHCQNIGEYMDEFHASKSLLFPAPGPDFARAPGECPR